MRTVNLCGEWLLSGGKYHRIKATVPGCVHTDLMNAQLIPDPYYRDNEKQLMWVGETDWEYTRNFILSDELLCEEKVLLRCEGLDTFAVVRINGHLVAKTDNMFRTWEFNIKDYVQTGENTLSILFESTFPYIQRRNEERWLFTSGIGHHRIEGSNWVRKMQCNYGWDWGPMCVTCGIWRNIEVIGCSTSKISDVLIAQEHHIDEVNLKLDIHMEKFDSQPIKTAVEILFEGQVVQSIRSEAMSAIESLFCTIKNPKLWWPNNLGEQNLYEVNVCIYDLKDQLLDTWNHKIGLRTLRLDRHPDSYGESFQFVVNGVPFFAKGANWIPADTFVTRTSDEFYRQLVSDAASANMNFLRVWGGGIYEQNTFYELCDQYGICIWQDFMFACAAYPAFDAEYMKNVQLEAIDNVKRLRNHACMALWCGNNEMEQMASCCIDSGDLPGGMGWDAYEALFDVLLPDIVHEYAPGMDYWPSSPHTSKENRKDFNNPTSGDAHLWDVWHGRKPFEWYRTCEHRFNSEFGFQSFPEPQIVAEYTLPADRNVTSYVMELHQRSGIGNAAILQYMLSWYKLPTSFDTLLWLSQVLQGMAMKYAVEHWRRKMPQGMGTLYWQINDCWPVASWASIDYKGNWKALHYMARKFYNPVLISCIEDMDKNTAEIHLTNDTLEAVSGIIHWRLVDTSGLILAQEKFSAEVGPNRSTVIHMLDLTEELEKSGNRNVLLHIAFEKDQVILSDNISLFCRPKHMELIEPKYVIDVVETTAATFEVQLSSDVPALWVWPEIQGICAKYSDRFFHLMPWEDKKVAIQVPQSMSLDEFREKLVISNLTDTYK